MENVYTYVLLFCLYRRSHLSVFIHPLPPPPIFKHPHASAILAFLDTAKSLFLLAAEQLKTRTEKRKDLTLMLIKSTQ